jgi:hypothetical protein
MINDAEVFVLSSLFNKKNNFENNTKMEKYGFKWKIGSIKSLNFEIYFITYFGLKTESNEHLVES